MAQRICENVGCTSQVSYTLHLWITGIWFVKSQLVDRGDDNSDKASQHKATQRFLILFIFESLI